MDDRIEHIVGRLYQLVVEAVKEGCGCDIMYGYACSIHRFQWEARKLCDEYEKEATYVRYSGTGPGPR